MTQVGDRSLRNDGPYPGDRVQCGAGSMRRAEPHRSGNVDSIALRGNPG